MFKEAAEMMKSGGTSPTLDDPPLPEFSGATLHLQQKDGGGTGRTSGQPNANKLVVRESSQEIFVDLVDLSLTKSGNDQAAEAEAPIRKRRNTSPDSNESLYAASPLADGLARGYFSSRESLLERALHDCKKILVHDDNGPLLGSWLLTQVDHWDNEKERLVLLCGRALFIVKYDFIALNLLDYMRLNLNKVSTLTIGRLCYPTRSITPKVQLVANRVTNIFKGCLQQLGQEAGRGGGLLNLSSTWRTGVQADQPQANADGTGQQDREGVRLTWRATIEPIGSAVESLEQGNSVADVCQPSAALLSSRPARSTVRRARLHHQHSGCAAERDADDGNATDDAAVLFGQCVVERRLFGRV